jgi:hypothetical protein
MLTVIERGTTGERPVRYDFKNTRPSILIEGSSYYTVVVVNAQGHVENAYQIFLSPNANWIICGLMLPGCVDQSDVEARQKGRW